MNTIRCRMDGLQVLKGGTAKATVYFDTKDATKAALDLNEQGIVIGLPEASATACPETLEEVTQAMTAALAEVALCSRKLVAMADTNVKLEHPLFVHPSEGDFPGHRGQS